MKILSRLFVKAYSSLDYLYDEFLAFFYKRAFGSCGKNVMIKPSTSIFKGIENFHISDNVRIARYAVIYSTNAKVFIGEKVGIAPYLKIITGNHNFSIPGYYMFDGNYAKNENDDKDVVVEGDNWIGINVTMLAGTVVGRGSCVAAGALLNKSYPPYSIIAGVPAKVLKYRFTIDQILEHEEKLYPKEIRYSREELESMMLQRI